tara:strand:- start:137 stop:457 length:321 start_codon:yes stop_codon:yes gene_type:complete
MPKITYWCAESASDLERIREPTKRAVHAELARIAASFGTREFGYQDWSPPWLVTVEYTSAQQLALVCLNRHGNGFSPQESACQRVYARRNAKFQAWLSRLDAYLKR